MRAPPWPGAPAGPARLAARRITNFLDQRMQGSGFSIAQFGLMAQIAAALDDTLGALAERTVYQSTLSRDLLRGLETAGLAQMAVVADDQRRRACGSPRGARRLQAAIPLWRDAHAAIEQRLDSAPCASAQRCHGECGVTGGGKPSQPQAARRRPLVQ